MHIIPIQFTHFSVCMQHCDTPSTAEFVSMPMLMTAGDNHRQILFGRRSVNNGKFGLGKSREMALLASKDCRENTR